MADSIGKGFPTTNLQIGHVFCDIDDFSYWKYLGGPPASVASWVLFQGILPSQPDTSEWGLAQAGAMWFIPSSKTYYGWDGRQIITVAFAGGPSEYQALREISVQDDFMTGGNSGGLIGWLGWASGAGTIVGQQSEDNHPGIFRLSTGTTPGTVARMSLILSSSLFLVGNIELIFVVRLLDIDADSTARFGFGGFTGDNPPSDGAYIEKVTSDTEWFAVTRIGGVQTRTNTGRVVNATFVDARIKIINGTDVEFYLDHTLVATHANAVTTAILSPLVQVINAAGVSKAIDIDYAQLKVKNLER